MIIFLYPLVVHFAYSAWSDTLNQGSIQGYPNTTEVSTFLSSLGFSKSDLAVNPNNNSVSAYRFNASNNQSPYTIIITSGHTSSQPLSVSLAMYLAGYFTQTSSSFESFIKSYFNFYIVPIINVNAYDAMYKSSKTLSTHLKNLNSQYNCSKNPGVDLNRNFDFQFSLNNSDGSSDPCSDTYKGPQAFSEAETQSVKSVLATSNILVWLHIDGTGDQIEIPWTYNSTLTDFSSPSLNSLYTKLNTSVSAVIGNSGKLNLSSFGGSFIDYGASLGLFSLQLRLGSKVLDPADIIPACANYTNLVSNILKLTVEPLELSYNGYNVTKANLTINESMSVINLNFTVNNPSFVDHQVELNVLLSNISQNISVVLNGTKGRRLDGSSSFSLLKKTSKTVIFTISLKGANLNFTFIANAKLQLAGSSNISAYSYLASKSLSNNINASRLDSSSNPPVNPSSPNSSNGTDLFLRTWFKSSEHHEGVAIGITSALLCVILVLVILFIFKMYRSEPDEELLEVSSNYVKKEVKTFKPSESNSNLDTFKKKGESSPLKDTSFDFKNSSVPLNNKPEDKPSHVINVPNVSNPRSPEKIIRNDDSPKPTPTFPKRSDSPARSPGPGFSEPKNQLAPVPKIDAPDFQGRAEIRQNPPVVYSDSPKPDILGNYVRPPGPSFRDPKDQLAPIPSINAPEFQVRAEVKQNPLVLTPELKKPEPNTQFELRKPVGQVIIRESNSEDEIEIIHGGKDVKNNQNIYRPPTKSDDGEFGIIQVHENKGSSNNANSSSSDSSDFDSSRS